MAISQGSTLAVEFIKETTIGTTPLTPQTILIPYINFSMEMDRDVFVDPSRNPDNQQRFMSNGAFRTSGNLETTYNISQFDDFILAGLMGSAWTTNVAKTGNTKTGFTFGEWDSVNSINRVFTGTEINTIELNVSPTDVAKLSFGMLGRAMTLGTTQLDSTPTAIQNKSPMTHVAGFCKIDNAVAYVTSAKVMVNNSISQVNVLGQNSAYGTSLGQKSVTGTLTLVFEDTVMYNKYINGTAAALEIQLTDGTSSHTWKLPNIKLNKVTAASDAGVRILTCDFTGLYDATLGAIISVTRTV